MSSGRKRSGGKSKANIHMSKPELPPFLQKMREKIVANEDADRKDRADQKRKNRPGGGRDPDDEDDPTVVKLNDDDITEEEYKRMKLELETQYKLDDADKSKSKRREEFDIDDLISIGQSSKSADQIQESINKLATSQHRGHRGEEKPLGKQRPTEKKEASLSSKLSSNSNRNNKKQLSYGSSSDDDDDD